MESRVLFVDDEDEILKNYQDLFKSKGKTESELLASALFNEDVATPEATDEQEYAIFTARQGIEAVEIFDEQLNANEPIDIVFLDMRMPPGIDGGETAMRMKRLDPKVEVVIASAYSDINLDSLIEHIGHPDRILFLKKPFSTDEVIQIVRNLSEKKRLEKAQDRLLHNISHELRTPLSSILGFSDLIQSESMGEEALRMAKIIHRNGLLMEKLISDLIDTALLDAKRMNFLFSERSIDELVKKVQEEHSHSESGGRVIVKSSGDLGKAYIDEERIIQAVNCLISNGLKFSKNTDPIEIAFTKSDNSLSIAVKDRGIGIPKSKFDAIFRRFYCIDQTHEKQGMGLGLSICQQIISNHKGKIEVQSNLNEGSTFTITIPMGAA